MVIFNIIAIAAITYLFIESEPLILIKRFLGFKEENYNQYGKVKAFIYRLITCALCSGFWIGLMMTHSLQHAALISLAAETITRLMKRF